MSYGWCYESQAEGPREPKKCMVWYGVVWSRVRSMKWDFIKWGLIGFGKKFGEDPLYMLGEILLYSWFN